MRLCVFGGDTHETKSGTCANSAEFNQVWPICRMFARTPSGIQTLRTVTRNSLQDRNNTFLIAN